MVFAFLYLWPVLERRVTGDRRYHNLLERPRDNPWRTAIGVGFVTWVLLVFVAGGADRIQVLFDLGYPAQIWLFRVLFFVAPPVTGAIAYRVCVELRKGELVARERRLAEQAAREAREPPLRVDEEATV